MKFAILSCFFAFGFFFQGKAQSSDILTQRPHPEGTLFFIRPLEYSTKGWGGDAPFDHTFLYREDSVNAPVKVNFTISSTELRGKPDSVILKTKEDSLSPIEGPELFYVEKDGRKWETRIGLLFEWPELKRSLKEEEHHYRVVFPQGSLKLHPERKTLKSLKSAIETISLNLEGMDQ